MKTVASFMQTVFFVIAVALAFWSFGLSGIAAAVTIGAACLAGIFCRMCQAEANQLEMIQLMKDIAEGKRP